MRCPSCGYVRKPEDLAPEWQCPSCQVAYTVAPDKTVLLYTRSGCGYCVKAKKFLQEHDIAFEEIDVDTIERGKEDFQKLGAIGVPIIIVADTKVIGFDEAELKSVLKSKGLWK